MNTITLTEEQIDGLVINNLKQTLEMQFDLDTDEGGDYIEHDIELVEALKTVLRYYMSHNEINNYFKKIATKEAEAYELLEAK